MMMISSWDQNRFIKEVKYQCYITTINIKKKGMKVDSINQNNNKNQKRSVCARELS